MLAEQDVKDCSPQWVFAYAQEQELPVAVQLYDGEAVAGMVRQRDDGAVFLNCLDENGRWNGVSQIQLDSISKIRCNSSEERLLLSLKAEL